MKKNLVWMGILIAAMMLAFSGLAGAVTMKIYAPSELDRPTGPLYGEYPFVGVDDASAYYLDPSSCYYSIEGDKAILGALVYATAGGAMPDGGPAKLGKCTVTFATYREDGERVIETEGLLPKISKYSRVEDSQEFYDSLFWTIAETTGLASGLD